MTVQLLDQDAPPAVAYFLRWLLPLTGDPTPNPAAVGMSRPDGAPLPFWMVHVIDEADNADEGVSDGVVSVHIIVPKTDTTLNQVRRTHRRMNLLARNPLVDVPMADGTVANLDYLHTIEKPTTPKSWDINTVHYVGRYGYGLAFVDA